MTDSRGADLGTLVESLGLALTMTVTMTAFGSGCNFSASDVSIVPDHPTYERDVKPILDDHCNLCHGDPANRGAPDYFRLDVYESKGRIAGAADMALLIVEQVDQDEMPPAAGWGDGLGKNAKAVLERWFQDGVPQ